MTFKSVCKTAGLKWFILFLASSVSGEACAKAPSEWVSVEFNATSSATYEFKCRELEASLTFSDDGGSRPLLKQARFNGEVLKTSDEISIFSKRVMYVAHFVGTCHSEEIQLMISGKANVEYGHLDNFAVYLSINSSGIRLKRTACISNKSRRDVKAAKEDSACQSVTTPL